MTSTTLSTLISQRLKGTQGSSGSTEHGWPVLAKQNCTYLILRTLQVKPRASVKPCLEVNTQSKTLSQSWSHYNIEQKWLYENKIRCHCHWIIIIISFHFYISYYIYLTFHVASMKTTSIDNKNSQIINNSNHIIIIKTNHIFHVLCLYSKSKIISAVKLQKIVVLLYIIVIIILNSYTHTHIHIYIYIYTHTHTHTHKHMYIHTHKSIIITIIA